MSDRQLSAEKKRKLEELRLARPQGELSLNDSPLTKRDRICRKVIDGGIIGLLLFSPLPAGSVHEWSILVIQIIVFAMAGAYLLMREKPKVNPLLVSSLQWPRYLFVALFVLIAVQVVPLPVFFVKVLSSQAYSLRSLFGMPWAGIKGMSLTLVPDYTLRAALELSAYFLLGLLIIKTVTSYRQIMRIVYVLIGMAVFQSLYGLFELYNKNPRILFYEKTDYFDAVTGTFINRNHLSGYLEMIVPLTIGLALARTDFFNLSGLRWKEKLVRIWGRGVYSRILLPVSIVVMSIAIIFSKSRSGIFLLVLSFLLIFELSVLYFRGSVQRRKTISRFLKLVFLSVTFFSLYIGIDGILHRFSTERFLKEYRQFYWAQTWDIVRDFPVTGSGLGTFECMYPVYDRIMIPAQFSHAHNDYLEYLSELGVLGLALFFGGAFFILARSFLAWRGRSNAKVKGLGMGGIVSVTLLLLHSLTDFNLHIPANMILFSVILALTAVVAFYKKTEQDTSAEVVVSTENLSSNSSPGNRLYHQRIKEWRKFINRKERSAFRTFLSFLSIALLVFGAVIIYRNHYLTARGKNTGDHLKRMEIYRRANRFYPLNDRTYFELGKTRLALGLQNWGFNELRNAHLQESMREFETSLKYNPLSPQSHFYLGQALHNLSRVSRQDRVEGQALTDQNLKEAVGADYGDRSLEEFKKAAMLTRPYHQISFEVGKMLLSKWNEMAEGDRGFTLDFLERMYRNANREQLLDLMLFWEMNVRDFAVMDSVLPETLTAYRLYAQFLGERALSGEERRLCLAKAEKLQFEQAKEEYEAGKKALMYSRVAQASAHFEGCLDLLGRIKFYQELSGKKLIVMEDYTELRNAATLDLARCRILLGQSFAAVEPLLRGYLEGENRLAAIKDLEALLQKHGFIGREFEANADDLDVLAFHVRLSFKENRFSDIMTLGRLLQESFRAVPDSKKRKYSELLGLIGDAFQKRDYVYDAISFYRRAMELDPQNCDALLSLRRNYKRMNDENGIRETTQKIEKLLTPRAQFLNDRVVRKGKAYSKRLVSDGEEINLKIHFKGENLPQQPMVSVLFNNRVAWEGHTQDDILSLTLDPLEGENTLVLIPLNTDVVIQSITCE